MSLDATQHVNNKPNNGVGIQTPLDQLYKDLDTSEKGLGIEEAHVRYLKYGPNEPAPEHHASFLFRIFSLFRNPLVIILLVAAVVSGVLGDRINAGIILVIVLLSAGLEFIQNYRSERTAQNLRAAIAPTAVALREGAWIGLPRLNLVPGDVIRLVAGNLVPADARLIEAQDLHVQQSSLTGESLPVEKQAGELNTAPASTAESLNLLFLGTSVVSGTATALVVATGAETAFGDIAARLATRAPTTEFEHGTRRFGNFILWTVVVLMLFVFLVGAALKRPPFETFLFAVALAVGMTPEFLPMITTVTLSTGAARMARKKVIVKNLAAIQNLGSMDVLCSDKTGTLTTGAMTLERHVDTLGQPDERTFQLACVNSTFSTEVADPLNAAIMAHGKPELEGIRKVAEVPFDFERRRSSVVTEKNGQIQLIAKGAPESILDVCTTYETGGKPIPLDPEALRKCKETYQELSAEGYRILAVAWRSIAEQGRYKPSDECDMTLVGFVTFSDPLREDSSQVLKALHRDGVIIKIITGDNEMVARHICSQVGINTKNILLGSAMDTLTDSALGHIAEKTSVFARVSPAQKNRIILALKARGHVVGFLGDGINDAPSLHAADVGISVSNGYDVAKEAASIILTESGLGVLHNGIVEGRKAFGNVMKYLLMGTSSNFGNMFSMAGATLFLPFLPMLPTQILLNNLLYDLAQITIPTDQVDASYIRKPKRWDIKIVRDFMLYVGPISSIYDFLTFWVLLKVFHSSEQLFHTGWFVESLATQTLVVFIIRTAGNPFRSKPSRPLMATILTVVAMGTILPFTPMASILGFTPLPAMFFVFLIAVTITYLMLVEVVKRRLMNRLAAIH